MLNAFLGNSEIKETIKSAVLSGRFPHAFIIEGEEGSGRRTLARIIAAAAVCESENAPCGECRACNKVSTQNHSDILTYEPNGATFKVETVRKIRDSAFIMPIEAKRKVNILIDCDTMNESAQNALLKVLEEPPSFMVFILICRSASSLLPTVRSRCITLTVMNPEPDESIPFIKQRFTNSEAEITEALIQSHGNIGLALDILNGVVSNSSAAAKEYFDFVLSGNRLGAVKIILKFEKDRLGFSKFLDELEKLICNELKQSALGNNSKISKSTLARIYRTVTEQTEVWHHHVGQPLSLSVFTTALTAEIFADI